MHGREVQIPSKRFGLIPATLIPMDENFKVDYGQLESYARWLTSYDIGGIAVNVDTGEGSQLYPEERVNVLKAFSEVVKVCPYDALSFGDVDRIEIPIPDQDRCDNCGLCVSICTAKTIFLDKVDKTTTSW